MIALAALLFVNPVTGPALLSQVATGFEIAANAVRVVEFVDQQYYGDPFGSGFYCPYGGCPHQRYYHHRHRHHSKGHK